MWENQSNNSAIARFLYQRLEAVFPIEIGHPKINVQLLGPFFLNFTAVPPWERNIFLEFWLTKASTL